MAGRQHQRILGLLVRQMRLYGCTMISVEGVLLGAREAPIAVPPRVLRHRPDAMGILPSQRLCIGDAKTASDLRSKRTREQLLDFTSVEVNGMSCEVFFGVPKAAEARFRAMLSELQLLHLDRVHVLYVPDKVIGD